MSDFHLVDPQGWEYDLQSVYSAYMGYFQLHGVAWHDRTWGQYFETFDQFLAFSWPVVTVTDTRTGRAHIVTRSTSINAFLKMIKTRFGEALPQVDNLLRITPSETSQRHLRHINDWSSYKKIHLALPAVALSALKARVRAGDPSAIRGLWATRDKTFLAIDFECLERNDRACMEWGYAAIRSGHLEAAGAWPPVPHTNYRKGHYVVSEHADRPNKGAPSLSWQYAFGESQAIPKARMPRIIQSVLSGLVSPDSETVANSVVLVAHGVQAIMQRLEEMKIKLPNNTLVVDISYLERALFTTGQRGSMVDRKSGQARLPESLLSLRGLLHSFGVDPPCALHNAGNDAFMTLVMFQRMVDPKSAVAMPRVQSKAGKEVPSGRVGRASTVTSRLFRPLSMAQFDLGKNGREDGHGNAGVSISGPTPLSRQSGDGVDEMGMNVNVNVNPKRASMFSVLGSPAMEPTDKNRKEVGNASSVNVNAKRASVFSTLGSPGTEPADKNRKEVGNASSVGSGRWLSPSMRLPGKKRRSVMQSGNIGEV